ncbi:hypothetical protein F4553_006535 [Allocatelliglobosispora scoriae]|uniref:Uncharacterized protein n=1 Tax=Allocatelliglobosispora scoriae TaxID=643052 RepID=A0A841C2M4_9ACTN|nr:hypothetical protein [Allocatelliglobosispora scoriae]MBB5873101.1 hypothetical protein [Allocatelliglobosispora scoriae]
MTSAPIRSGASTALDFTAALLQGALCLVVALVWTIAGGRLSPPWWSWWSWWLTPLMVLLSVLVLLLFASSRGAEVRNGGGAYELRGILIMVCSLAQVGFLLRENDEGMALREFALFTLGTAAFVGADQLGARIVGAWRRHWAYIFLGVALAAVGALFLSQGYVGTIGGTVLGAAPAPIVSAATVGFLAAWLGQPESPRPPLLVQLYAVTFPSLALFAFTADLGAGVVMFVGCATVLVVAHFTTWSSAQKPWPRLGRAVAVVLGGVAVLAVGALIMVKALPNGKFSAVAGPPGADLLGSPIELHRTAELLGDGRFLLVLIVLVLVVQLVVLASRTVRNARPATVSTFPMLLVVGIAAQVIVAFLAPVLGVLDSDLPVPMSMGALPVAADGASFLLTMVCVGLAFGVGSREPDLRS